MKTWSEILKVNTENIDKSRNTRVVRTDIDYIIVAEITRDMFNNELKIFLDDKQYDIIKLNYSDSYDTICNKIKSIVEDFIKSLNREYVYYDYGKYHNYLFESITEYYKEWVRINHNEKYLHHEPICKSIKFEIQVCNSDKHIEEEYQPFEFLINGLRKVFSNER